MKPWAWIDWEVKERIGEDLMREMKNKSILNQIAYPTKSNYSLFNGHVDFNMSFTILKSIVSWKHNFQFSEISDFVLKLVIRRFPGCPYSNLSRGGLEKKT